MPAFCLPLPTGRPAHCALGRKALFSGAEREATRSQAVAARRRPAEDQAELRRLLGIVYAKVAVGPYGTRARIW